MTTDTTNAICNEVAQERANQDARWGTQRHDGLQGESARRQFQSQADLWHDINDARVAAGQVTWDGILLEEVYEALAETDLEARRVELIQVAAVAVAEVEEIDRRLAAGDDEESLFESDEDTDAADD